MNKVRILVAILGVATAFVHRPLLSADPESGDGETVNVQADVDVDALLDDDLDALLDIAENDTAQLGEVRVVAPALQEVVSTVSRKASTVGKSPTAVFVITNEMIRRSGARSIPEILRMVPGVQVARIDGNKWEVSIRGFNNRYANKLLIQIDGRSVYTPLFAGTFWDVQNVVLEDVERIEVIRGPGATVWGANAVNGVINIITKKAKDTQGVFVESGGGTERAFSNARAGGQIGDNLWYRVYGKWYERDAGGGRGFDPADDSRMALGGARLDWEIDDSTVLTVQGDYYDGTSGTNGLYAAPLPAGRRRIDSDDVVSGGNILTRLTHTVDESSDWALQFYYDYTDRTITGPGARDTRDMIDLDFQYRLSPWVDHSVIWGLGYRYHTDKVRTSPFFLTLTPNEREFDLVSAFIQDEMTLIDDTLTFTAGSKFEHNDFSGFEFQPSARLLWTPTERQSVWASVSRAVRTPSRINDAGRLTLAAVPEAGPAIFPLVVGNTRLEAEDLIAYEAGYREQVTDEFAWDLAVFFHNYTDTHELRVLPPTFQLPEGPVLPQVFSNDGSHQRYGFELSSTWQVAENLRLLGTYSFLRAADSNDEPRNRYYIQGSWDITECVEADAILRYVDGANGTEVDQYTVMDLRLAYRPSEELELFIVGRNLLDGDRTESVPFEFSAATVTNVEPEVFAGLSLRF